MAAPALPCSPQGLEPSLELLQARVQAGEAPRHGEAVTAGPRRCGALPIHTVPGCLPPVLILVAPQVQEEKRASSCPFILSLSLEGRCCFPDRHVLFAAQKVLWEPLIKPRPLPWFAWPFIVDGG